ncbi:MAG: hypothetical protein ABID64_01895 [Nitrospirota bacterium]
MKNIRKKIIAISLCLSILIPTSGAMAASSDTDANVEGGLSFARCIQKGNTDFVLFLNTFIFNDGFYNGVIEPWKDILMRNKCQATDISGLIIQQDKMRQYIRDAFLTCKSEKVPALKRGMDELKIEIYYVRNIVDGTVVASMPFDLISTRQAENPETLKTSTAKIDADIKEKYSSKTVLSDSELDILIAKLHVKYKDRVNEYIKCTNDAWSQVSKKWKEFVDSAGGLGTAAKTAEKEIAGAAEKLVESVNADSLKATYKGWLQININNLEAKEGLTEIANKLKQNVPGTGSSGTITQSALLDAISVTDTNYDLNKTRAEMNTKFKSLYKETSDSGTQLLVTGLDTYNKTLTETFPILAKILEGTKDMNKRQCPGKF